MGCSSRNRTTNTNIFVCARAGSSWVFNRKQLALVEIPYELCFFFLHGINWRKIELHLSYPLVIFAQFTVKAFSLLALTQLVLQTGAMKLHRGFP